MITQGRQVFTCSGCHQSLEANEFYWSRGRHSGFCKACQADYVSERRREKARSGQRLRKYGLTDEGYQRRLEEQRGGCAICGAPPAGGTGFQRSRGVDPVLQVDHNHETGEVRGLLCSRCNNLLARVKDDAALLRSASDYLRRSGHVSPIINPTPVAAAPAAPAMVTPPDPAPQIPARSAADVAEVLLDDESAYPEPRNYHAEAMDADLMPGGGVEHQRTSEFQERRRVQVALLQDAWREMIGSELQPDAAKRFLSLADNYAEDVLDVVEKARSPNVHKKFAWVKTLLESQQRDRRAQEAPVAANGAGGHSVRSASSNVPHDSEDSNYYLDDWTPETKRKMALYQRGIEKGLIVEDDEDWEE